MTKWRLRDRWSLFVYNWFRLPWNNWYFRHRFMGEWIAEGRDPERMPRMGRMSLDDLDWARSVAIDHNSSTRPYAEWRQSISRKV